MTILDEFSPIGMDAESAWVGHIPFGIWLGRALSPSVFVELGVHQGHSFFNISQGVFAANPEAACVAVDTWEGDSHSGAYGREVFERVKRINRQEFQDRCRLIRSTFDGARDQIEDGSVELLHIDGLHTYEAVKHDFESWLPKLSPHGVVLFHDIFEQQQDFGVWQFWEELRARFERTIEFSHSSGLGVLCLDGQGPDVLRGLEQQMDLFRALGEGLTDQVRLHLCRQQHQETYRVQTAQIAWLQGELERRQAALDVLQAKVPNGKSESPGKESHSHCQELKDSHRLLLEQIARLQPSGIQHPLGRRCAAWAARQPPGLFSGPKGWLFKFLLKDQFTFYYDYGFLKSSDAFRAQYYLEQNPDVLQQGMDPLLHWLNSGCREGRRPHPQFDPHWYLQRYADVRKSGINPLVHYLKTGAAEGRSPSENCTHL
jgi:hypothetical protein